MRIVLKPGGVMVLIGAVICLVIMVFWSDLKKALSGPSPSAVSAPSPSAPVPTAAASATAGPRPVPTVGPDGSIQLLAGAADRHGSKLQIESKGKIPNIGYWSEAAEWISWKVPAAASAKTYRLTLQYAAMEQTSFDVELDGKRLIGTVKPTGDFSTFHSAELGELGEKPGSTHVLSIRPRSANSWHPMNVQYLQLTPVNR